jgi:hypothetical protein
MKENDHADGKAEYREDEAQYYSDILILDWPLKLHGTLLPLDLNLSLKGLSIIR